MACRFPIVPIMIIWTKVIPIHVDTLKWHADFPLFQFWLSGVKWSQYMNNFPTIISPRLCRCAFRRLWWAQDGAPAHRLIRVRNRLEELFGNRVIALNHRVEWPPRSPDLTPCDFFLWGYLKSKVYTTPPHSIDDLRARLNHEVNVLRNNPEMIRKSVRDMRRRCQLCIERNGGHVEIVSP